jgi:hypothetical protein
VSSSSQRTDSASTSTNRRNDSARIVNAVTGEFADSARFANLRRPPSETGLPARRRPAQRVEGRRRDEALARRPGPDRAIALSSDRLDMLDETLAEDRDAALARAARIAAGEEA